MIYKNTFTEKVKVEFAKLRVHNTERQAMQILAKQLNCSYHKIRYHLAKD